MKIFIDKVKQKAWLVVAVLAFTSCQKDNQTGQLPEVKYPMIFTAAVEGMAITKTTTENSWKGNETVAVQVNSEVKSYTAATDGTLSSTTPFYWQSYNGTQTVTAWCPYSVTAPTSFSVRGDQNASDGYQTSDLLYAKAVVVSYSGAKQLAFIHLPVKVVVNLTNGKGVTEDNIKNATVTFLNQSLTSGTINYNSTTGAATVTQVTTGTAAIIPKAMNPASGYIHSVQALLVPQECSTKQFIKVTIGNNDYYYVPKTGEANLTASNQYTYNITVKKEGITVTFNENGMWNSSGEGTSTSKIIAANSLSTDLKVGDYYYSDGTWSDGGCRKYTDGSNAILDIRPVLKDASGKARTVDGIVYWVGDMTSNDALLKADHPDCTHGLVVALQESEALDIWSASYIDISNTWLSSQGGIYKITTLTAGDKMQGYANTKALTEYNLSAGDALVRSINYINAYSQKYPAPTSSSGWYLPSIMELKDICWGQGGNGGLAGRDLLNAQLRKAGGISLSEDDPYWTSSESNDKQVFGIYFLDGSYRSKLNKNANWCRSRGILAF